MRFCEERRDHIAIPAVVVAEATREPVLLPISAAGPSHRHTTLKPRGLGGLRQLSPKDPSCLPAPNWKTSLVNRSGSRETTWQVVNLRQAPHLPG